MMINVVDHGQTLTVDFNWQGKKAQAVKHEFKPAESQTDAPGHFVGHSEKKNDNIEIFLKDLTSKTCKRFGAESFTTSAAAGAATCSKDTSKTTVHTSSL